jgi:hypothetical protein
MRAAYTGQLGRLLGRQSHRRRQAGVGTKATAQARTQPTLRHEQDQKRAPSDNGQLGTIGSSQNKPGVQLTPILAGAQVETPDPDDQSSLSRDDHRR